MSSLQSGLAQLAVLLVLLGAVYVPFGNYLAKVLSSPKHWRAERALYRIIRIDPDTEQRWTVYAAGVLGLSLVSVLFLYLIQRLQPVLPLGFGRGVGGDTIPPAMAFNTAVSFVTNTNWQSYVPETTYGHTVGMVGLTVQNFLSAAVGMAVAGALIRGFTRGGVDRVGNFWVDVVRATVRVLLPIACIAAIALVAMGAAMSLRSGVTVTGLDGARHTIALAPAASQESIKELGTNGGGIFNANSAHPFENPTGGSNLLEILLMLVIPVCLTRAFGVLVGNTRQGHVLVAVMGTLWGGLLAVAWWAENHVHEPAVRAAGAAMEGKEVRFGIPSSVLFEVSTTGTSTGAVNSAHDSLTGLGGGVALLNMLLGEVTPGGVGTGLYGILVVAVVAVFLAGLMVGRTPEYLGKKLGRREVTAAAISILAMPALVLVLTGCAIALPSTSTALGNTGPHGFAEVLYAYASCANNNGSAFAGLTVTSGFFQSTLGIAMLFGRFVPILATLALAGSLAAQRRVTPGAGTLPTDGPLFAVLVAGTVVIVAALTFFPALGLGPIAEALA